MNDQFNFNKHSFQFLNKVIAKKQAIAKKRGGARPSHLL